MAKTYLNVPAAKVLKVKELVERTMDGDRIAKEMFVEGMATSDMPIAFGALVNGNLLNQYPVTPKIWPEFASRKLVQDFRNVTYFDVFQDLSNLEGKQATSGDAYAGGLPVVPELSPYQTIGITENHTNFAVKKRGVQLGFSWEQLKNDTYGVLDQVIPQLAVLAANTEDIAATAALTSGVTSATQITTGNGYAASNPVLSLDALQKAIANIQARRIGGRQVIATHFKLIVPPSLYQTALNILHTTERWTTNGSNQDHYTIDVGNVDVVLDNWFSTVLNSNAGTSWYVVPAVDDTFGRPSVIQAFLAGYETPEFRVGGMEGGQYAIGGADVPWQEGSFDNDALSFRLRVVGGSGFISENAVAWSSGAGS